MTDAGHGGILDPALYRYGIEAFLHSGDFADLLDLILSLNLFRNHRGRREYSDAAMTESLKEGAVLEFSNNSRSDLMRYKPLLKRPAHRGIFRRKKHGSVIQRFREVASIPGCQIGAAKKRYL